MAEKRNVYLDNNATTKVDERTADFIRGFFEDNYAIASSQFSHSMGIRARDAVEVARQQVAGMINAEPGEIVFTSGGTESNNLALQGLFQLNKDGKRKKLVISPIEHFSVMHTAQMLRENGFELEFCRVDEQGFVDMEHLGTIVDDNTLLVSIIHGNHEMGTIQDLSAISGIAHNAGSYFHTDASVSFGQVPIDVKKSGIDLLSMTAHKIYGPKGVGALFLKKGIQIKKILHGGFSENNLRAGTENVPGIAGFGKAVEILSRGDIEIAESIRDYLYERIISGIENVNLNGSDDFRRRLPNNLNISFGFIEGESIVLHLDLLGISAITGSACFSRNLQASHILMAMGFSHQRAHSSVRFSTSKYLKKVDIDYTFESLKGIVENLRRLSPLYNKE